MTWTVSRSAHSNNLRKPQNSASWAFLKKMGSTPKTETQLNPSVALGKTWSCLTLLPGRPGHIREFDSCREKSWENVGKNLARKTGIYDIR